MKIGIYAGTFDPVTNGHIDLFERASHLFEKVIVGIAHNEAKNPIFSHEERLQLVKDNIAAFPNIEAIAFDGLTVDFAKKHKAHAIIRGLRAVSDFEYEFQMAQMNRHMNKDVETIFLMPSQDHFYTSSKLIKSISKFNPERIAPFVPKNVLEALEKKFA